MAACLSCAVGSSRRADAEPSPTDRPLAQSLFDQAKELMDAGRYGEACPKLAESQRLDPGGGTLLNLALCHEREGRLATAWADFKEALGAARQAGRADREQAARAHIEALEPRLARLTLEVPRPDRGLTVRIDGELVGGAAWNAATPVDPGSHEVTAEAPEKRAWRRRVEVRSGQQTTLSVPPLESEPAVAVVPAPAARAETTTSAIDVRARSATPKRARRAAAYIAGGAGVAALVLGSAFGIQAISRRHASDPGCPSDDTCTVEGKKLNDEARTAALRSDLAIGAGVVGLGVAAYLFLRPSPSGGAGPTDHALRVEPRLTASGAGLGLEGAW